MFTTKTLLATIVAVTFAGQTAAYSMPACWTSCFKTYNVTSEGSLCSATLGSVVGSCIASGCAAANSTESATQYSSWLCDYCHEDSTACGTTSSSSAAISTSTLSSSTTLITTTALVSTTPAAATGSGVPSTYSNGTITATYSYPAGPTSGNHSASSTPTAAPYTGGAAGLAASGSMLAVLGMAAVAFLS